MFHRAELVEAIYNGLNEEDQARIHTGKKLENIEETNGGVVVTCTDGSTYEGSIVLGADGVHSKTRHLMRELSLKKSPDADVNDMEPFQHQYKTMWCSFPRQWEFAPGDHCITHGSISSLQFLNASDRSWLFVYEKLESKTTERVSFTDEDMEEFGSKHGDMRIGDRLKVKDLFPYKLTGGMANLEEGILKHWSSGRIVLAGDSCHKFTPNAGLGFNNALQDVVALVNELHSSLDPGAAKHVAPGEDELGALFYRYQDARREMVLDDYKTSAHITRLCAWPNTAYWLVDQYLMPAIPRVNKVLTKYKFSPAISKALCLDFVEGEEPFEGKVPWVHPMKKPEK